MLPNLAFGVEQTRLAIEEGDEVRGTVDRDGPPEEGEGELSERFRREEERSGSSGRDFEGSEEVREDLGEDVEREVREGHPCLGEKRKRGKEGEGGSRGQLRVLPSFERDGLVVLSPLFRGFVDVSQGLIL